MIHLHILLNLSVALYQIPFIVFLVMDDTPFVSYKPLTFDCDLDLGCGNLILVHYTPSYFALSFCDV